MNTQQVSNRTLIPVDSFPTTPDECAKGVYAVQAQYELRCFCRFNQAQWVTWTPDDGSGDLKFIMVWHSPICPYARTS